MPPELGLATDDHNPDFTVLTVSGEVDVYTAPLLRQRLFDLAVSGVRLVLINLDPVGFLDSTGLGVLVAALNRFRREQGEVELVCSDPNLLRIFEITGLTRRFTIHPSLDAVSAGVS